MVDKPFAVTLLTVTVKAGLYNTVCSLSLSLSLLLFSTSSPLPHLSQKTSRHSGGSSFIAGRRSRSTSPAQEKHVSHHERPKKVRTAQSFSIQRGRVMWGGGEKGKSVPRALMAPQVSPDSVKSFTVRDLNSGCVFKQASRNVYANRAAQPWGMRGEVCMFRLCQRGPGRTCL